MIKNSLKVSTRLLKLCPYSPWMFEIKVWWTWKEGRLHLNNIMENNNRKKTQQPNFPGFTKYGRTWRMDFPANEHMPGIALALVHRSYCEWQLGKHSLLIKPGTIADVITTFCQLCVKMNFYLLLCREACCVNLGTFKQVYLGKIVLEEARNYSFNMTFRVYDSYRIIGHIISCSNENEYFLCLPSFYLTLNIYISVLIH